MVRPTLIDLNHVELNYYSFMVSLGKCSWSCSSADELSTKICVPSKTKDINVKLFNMITNKNEAKAMVKHISRDCKCKFNSATCNSNKKLNNDPCQCECKKYGKCKNGYRWNPSTCFCGNGKYLKIVGDISVIASDEIKYVMDIVLTNVANTITTNVTIIVSINFHKKVRYKIDCYILHTILLVIILLLIIAIICYRYAKHRSKLKKY